MAPQWKQEFGSAEKMLAEVNRDELIMVTSIIRCYAIKVCDLRQWIQRMIV